MAKCQGSILSFFGNAKKQQNHTNIECSVYLMFKVCCLLVLNATIKNISVISWRSVLLVEENGKPGNSF
jgi:hypothetical protein